MYWYLIGFVVILFFFNDTATTEIYTLSLHDALPISAVRSVELLSHTISSDFQPIRANPSMAARTLESEPGSSRSSLNAGTTTEIFISWPRFRHTTATENASLTGAPTP